MTTDKVVDQSSAGGVWQGFPYEQIIDEEGEHRLLVYRKNPMLDREYAKTGDWTRYYMADKYLEDSETGVTLVPMKRVPWQLTGTLPKERLDHNELWSKIKGFLVDHLDLADERQYDLLVSWVISTYMLERWDSVPYLFFLGPVKSGKTRALECLQHLCYRGVLVSNISGAALYRLVEDYKPTILLDETEIYNSEQRSDVIGLLNSGYRRGQWAMRARTDGKPGLIYYNVFGFKALAGTRGFRDTLESRSIIVSMFKATRDINLFLDREAAKELRMYLLLWKLEHFDTIDTLREGVMKLKEMLPHADGRILEKYYPLITVANAGRQQIIDYANNAIEIEQYADESSIEAELTQVLVDCQPQVINNVLKVKHIADKFNMNRDDREKWKTRTITKIVRVLGFNSKRATDGERGYYYDITVLEGLCKRYNLINKPTTPSTPEIASIASIVSNPSKDRILNNVLESPCTMCGEIPDKLYPDADGAFYICKPCKQKVDGEGRP